MDPLRIRVQAAAIRTRLLSRHSNAGFRRILTAMTDVELVEREAQFHADAVAYVAAPTIQEESTCTPTALVLI